MTPLTVFFRTLIKSSAIFVGAGYIMLHPSLDLRSTGRGAVTAQKSPAEAAIDGLVAALKDSDAHVRARAASALGDIGERTAVEPLIALIRDADVDVRSRAISALGEIGDARAVEPLTAALKDTDSGVRLRAVKALAELTDSSGPNPRPRPHPRPRPVVHLSVHPPFEG